jgi:hypothetical protein
MKLVIYKSTFEAKVFHLCGPCVSRAVQTPLTYLGRFGYGLYYRNSLLRAQGSAQLEQRLLWSKDGSGLWRGSDSTEVMVEVSDDISSHSLPMQRRCSASVLERLLEGLHD